jgi:tRNA A-37 threonylcarbamoyl transferase component Bud32
MTAIAIAKKAEILEMLAQGVQVRDVATTLGICHQAISKQLAHDPEYREAIECGYRMRLDECEVMIEQAGDQVEVARARAYWSAVSWRASREARAVYGDAGVAIVALDLGAALAQMSSELRRKGVDIGVTHQVIEHDSQSDQ